MNLTQWKEKSIFYIVYFQAVGVFSSALQSGQLAPLMGQFGFNEDVMGAASRGGILHLYNTLFDRYDLSCMW